MSQELIYTSAPRGLKPGSHGFCTVVNTQGITASLTQRLEALSGYRHVFSPPDPNVCLNPVLFSHLVFSLAGRRCNVLSRVCDAGLDHTQRTNKFAHHVVLDPRELVPGGPAWLLAAPGFMQSTWDGNPQVLPAGRQPPAGNSPAAICRAWQQITGDAGWGGVLAETASPGVHRVAVIIFRPGVDPLPLLAESLALLPPEIRWGVSFCTYFSKLPPGLECQWRCVLEGTPEAAASQRLRGALVIDLGNIPGAAPDSPLVQAARTGVNPLARVAVARTSVPPPARTTVVQQPTVAGAERLDDVALAQLLSASPSSANDVPVNATDFLSNANFVMPTGATLDSDLYGLGPPPRPENYMGRPVPGSTLPRKSKWRVIAWLVAVAMALSAAIVGISAYRNWSKNITVATNMPEPIDEAKADAEKAKGFEKTAVTARENAEAAADEAAKAAKEAKKAADNLDPKAANIAADTAAAAAETARTEVEKALIAAKQATDLIAGKEVLPGVETSVENAGNAATKAEKFAQRAKDSSENAKRIANNADAAAKAKADAEKATKEESKRADRKKAATVAAANHAREKTAADEKDNVAKADKAITILMKVGMVSFPSCISMTQDKFLIGPAFNLDPNYFQINLLGWKEVFPENYSLEVERVQSSNNWSCKLQLPKAGIEGEQKKLEIARFFIKDNNLYGKWSSNVQPEPKSDLMRNCPLELTASNSKAVILLRTPKPATQISFATLEKETKVRDIPLKLDSIPDGAKLVFTPRVSGLLSKSVKLLPLPGETPCFDVTVETKVPIKFKITWPRERNPSDNLAIKTEYIGVTLQKRDWELWAVVKKDGPVPISLEQVHRQVVAVNGQVKKLNSNLINCQNQISFHNSQIDNFKGQINALNSQIDDLKKKNKDSSMIKGMEFNRTNIEFNLTNIESMRDQKKIVASQIKLQIASRLAHLQQLPKLVQVLEPVTKIVIDYDITMKIAGHDILLFSTTNDKATENDDAR